MATREDLYRANFVKSRDIAYVSKFRPQDRARVPDYSWAILNSYEEFIPEEMTEDEKKYRWNLTPDELKEILSDRHDYTEWEICEAKRRQRSKKPEYRYRPTKDAVHHDDDFQPTLLAENNDRFMLALLTEFSNAEKGLIDMIGKVIDYRVTQTEKRIADDVKSTVKSIKKTVGAHLQTRDAVNRSIPVPEDVFVVISDAEYDTAPVDDVECVRMDYWDVVHALSRCTVIPPETCDSLLPLMDVPGSFPFKRALLFVRDRIAPITVGGNIVPWVRRNADGTYDARPFVITRERFSAAAKTLYPHHTQKFPAEDWNANRRLVICCPRHGESVILPKNYLNGKGCC